MTMKIAIRTLVLAGIITFGAAEMSAQQPVQSRVRRVPVSQQHLQPTSAAPVAAKAKADLKLTAQQSAKVDAMSNQVAALQTERTKLWSEYKAITARPDYSDDMAFAEAAPRMKRIVEINEQLAPIVARQKSELGTVLSPAQVSQVNAMAAAAN
ncbi:MAG: hypothetical protein IT211_00245 [Armatimonadetes bacterium]|nr:hypothetical protein [Armatimonadota bacterium]